MHNKTHRKKINRASRLTGGQLIKYRTRTGGQLIKYRTRTGGRSGNDDDSNSYSKINIKQTIILTFIEMLNTIQLRHWKTMSHTTHKATDEIHSKLSDNIDKFVEIMIGKNGERVELSSFKTIPLNDYDTDANFKDKIETYKTFLIGLSKDTDLNLENNTDLLNSRDEILGNLNQLTYLLTFK